MADEQPENAPDGEEPSKGAASAAGGEDEAARLAEDFRKAANALSEHIGKLPKAAAAALPTPRRVEPRVSPAPKAAPITEPAANAPPETPPEAPPAIAATPSMEDAPEIAARRFPPQPQPQPSPDPAPAPPLTAPAASAPIVARRLGADAAPLAPQSGFDEASLDDPIEAPEEAPKRERVQRARRPRAQEPLAPTAPTPEAPTPESPMTEAPLTEAPKKQKRRAPPRAKPHLRDLFALGVSLSFLGAITGLAGVFLVVAPWPEDSADLWAVNRTPAIVLQDRNGVEISARGARYGEAVSVSELPPYLVKAFLATEDRRFYEHGGVDLRGIIRAFRNNVSKKGGGVEGGSTITQQLARNLFLTLEQTYTRKAKEALLALWLEGRYSKDEILSLYLNRIYFGAGAYGIEGAAKTYFNKSARQVTLAEAAILAGLPKSPSTLAPTLNPLGAQDRAKEVIANLRETGEITEFDARKALANPPVIATGGEATGFGWFFDYVAEKARAIAGPSNYDIVVRTTFDQKLQRDAEAAVKTVLTVDAKVAGALQAALIAYDNDGAVRAMVGGRSYVESQFNRATQAKRQPGSAFKPIVYAAGFENGLSPQTRMVDQPIDIAGWKPLNYDNKFRGSMRLSEAVARSINTIAVQVSEKVGRPKVIQMARRLGMSSDIPAAEAGIALGGFSATLEELAAAYIPFADQGLGVRPYAIEEIADGRGRIIYARNARAPAPIFEKKVAKDVTHVLYQVMTTGTGKSANLIDRQAAGKTGTTNDYRDAWFIGYTAQMTTGVWVGNDDFQPMENITGGTIPAKIWKTFMLAAHQDLPKKPLDGAYAAVTYSASGRLLGYYNDVLAGLRRVQRDGDAGEGLNN